jgi:hypothetical protein
MCKAEGCSEPAVAARGPYAKLCAAHAQAKREQIALVRDRVRRGTEAAPPPAEAEPDMERELVLRAREVAHGEGAVAGILARTEEAIETAITVAANEIAQLLRDRLVEAIARKD